MASNTAARILTQARNLSRVRSKASGVSSLRARCMSSAPTSGYTHDEPIPSNYTIDSVKPPTYWNKPEEPEDPMAYNRKTVSSAHIVDTTTSPPKLSSQDSAALSPSGTVVHGRYGELTSLSPSSGIPLEYLALLHPAAEGAAALSKIQGSAASGTVLVYGAGEASGMAAVQLASSSGLAVVGVVSGEQSGNNEFVDALEGMTSEPGAIVTEEFAILKKNFRDVVQSAVSGQDVEGDGFDANAFVEDFQKNLLEYAEYFPETKLSPVPEDYEFAGKEKDRKYHDENISTYLSQFAKGSPAFDEVVLKEAFTKEQYAIFKSKFADQTTAVISGTAANVEFNPAVIAKGMTQSPEPISDYLKNQTSADSNGDFVPYEFSILKNQSGNGVDLVKGGPILGAIINVTPDLTVAAEAVAKAKTVRAKAEALQFLTDSQKNAFSAASSVVAMANEAGKPVVTVGGKLAGFETVAPTDADVQEVLSAMSLEEDGSSRLNYFLQIYRASDYPVYADYAIHRSQEALSGPRQIVVTK